MKYRNVLARGVTLLRRIVIVGLIATAGGLLLFGQLPTLVKRVFLNTTADPDVLGQVATTSMDPIEVALHTYRREIVRVKGPMGERDDYTGRTINKKIVFKAPAAYFSILDLKEGPGGPQRVGFSVWSEKFDPARPYLVEALRDRKPFAKSDPDNPTAGEKRVRETGEYVIDFQLSNYTLTESNRQLGLERMARGDDRYPCNREADPSLMMEVISVPDGVPATRSCLGGTSVNAKVYVKRSEEGAIKFVTECSGTRKRRPGICRLYGDYRLWPLYVWVQAQRPDTWNAAFDGLHEFLKSITFKETTG